VYAAESERGNSADPAEVPYPTSMIVLELTESTAINAPALMEHHMKELGDAGISFAMDDYGTGSANCSYLMRFPFQEVKMDRDMTLAYFNNETAPGYIPRQGAPSPHSALTFPLPRQPLGYQASASS